MKAKLSTGVLLIVALLLHCPAQGQGQQHTPDQAQSISMSKASFAAESASTLDFERQMAAETSVDRGFSAASLASKLIDVLASRNAITIGEIPSGPMDAYLRPPQKEDGDSGLFRQARSFYDSATTIHSRSAVVSVDPLSMRCAVRINLQRLLSQ